MKNSYDLTTTTGREEAADAIKTVANLVGWALFPVPMLIGKLLGKAVSNDDDAVAAESLIRAGKEQGLDSIEITMKRDAGLKLKGGVKGADVDVRLGAGGTVTVRAKYK